MVITTTTVLPPLFGSGPCSKVRYPKSEGSKKSTKNRIKFRILRMMKRREDWKTGLKFNPFILSAPVPDFIKKIVANRLIPATQAVIMKRCNSLESHIKIVEI